MDAEKIAELLARGRDDIALQGAKWIAGSVVHNNPENQGNTCAATLSSLLNFSGIETGLVEDVLGLAPFLATNRGWQRIEIGQPIVNGDVGVMISGTGSTQIHHIYLVVDAADQANPVVADNQGPGRHPRPVAGGNMPGVGYASPTTYFLRAT